MVISRIVRKQRINEEARIAGLHTSLGFTEEPPILVHDDGVYRVYSVGIDPLVLYVAGRLTLPRAALVKQNGDWASVSPRLADVASELNRTGLPGKSSQARGRLLRDVVSLTPKGLGLGDMALLTGLVKHAGPGDHPSGSPQSVHGGGSTAAAPNLRQAVQTAVQPADPERLFGDWGASLRSQALRGYRGTAGKGDLGFGNSEGDGLYLSKTPELAQFFGDIQRIEFIQPVSPLLIDNEPLYLLQESDEIEQPPSKKDSEWLGYIKQAYQRAKPKMKGKWNAETVGHELTRLLIQEDYDSVYVRSGGDEWIVLLEGSPALAETKRHNRFTKHLGPGDHPSGSPQDVHGGEAKSPPVLLYHGTAKSLVDKILKEGVRPRSETGVNVWEEWMPTDPKSSRSRSVFLAEYENVALEFAMAAKHKFGVDGVAIFRIEVPDSVVLMGDEHFPTAKRLEQAIPPEWIKGYKIMIYRGKEDDYRVDTEEVTLKARMFFMPIAFKLGLRDKVSDAA